MAGKSVSFPNAGGEPLAGILELPAGGRPRACALFAHCFTCTKNIRAAVRISQALADCGIAVLRFDFTGLGESEGDFGRRGFSANVSDLLAAADFLEGELAPPALMVGHSLGGLAVLHASRQVPACRAVATIGAPARAAHVRRHLSGADDFPEEGRATVDIGGRPFELSREFIDDLTSGEPDFGDLDAALLVMHSPLDTVVGIDNATDIFVNARHPKSFLSLDRADHLLSDAADAGYAARVIAGWADAYLPAAAQDDGAAAQDGRVTATTGPQGFHTPVLASGHRLTADEPARAGGEDTGPTPYGLLGAALAACTSMTLQMYARHKKIPLDEATVTVRHSRVHAEDCSQCETKSGRIDRFERDIRIVGELDETQRRRMLEIADKCPVHRTLHGEVEILSRLQD